MRRSSQLIWISLGVALLLSGCAGSGPATLGTIGKDPLTLEDFEASYAKNNGGWDKAAASTKEDRERFLDLLVKFRLKVMEATNRGLLADTAIQNEMEGYKIAVATSYMLEKEIVEPRIREMYNRTLEEVRASHILIRVDQNASPADTMAAYQKAMKVIGLIPRYRFDSIAVAYSEDPSVSTNKGDMGYFSSGKMVPEFEDACYQLKTGEYTLVPARSQFGYHVIKLTGRQKSKGSVRISHILWRFNDSANDSLGLKDTVQMVYDQLKKGLDFTAAVKQFSQDPGSKSKGGDIGFYERNKVPPEIGELFFSTPLDSVTAPLRMPYGYHIFKITGYSGVPTFEEAEKDLRQRYQQTLYNVDYERYIQSLKKRNRLYFDEVMVDRLAHSFDTTMTPSLPMWSDTLKNDFRQKVLFLCEERRYTVDDFIQHVNSSAEFKSTFLYPNNVRQIVNRMSEGKIVEENARLVPQRYPAFNKLLKEYQDGILLYRVEQDEVWKKIVVNDSLLKIFHRQNQNMFRWPERVNFAEIFVTSDSVAQLAYKEILAGKDFNDVAERYTMRPGYKEKKGVWGLTPCSENEFSRYAAVLPIDSIPPPFQHPNGWSIIKTIERDSARAKSFEEATPELLSAYQENASKVREQEWMNELHERYPVVLRKELLSEAFKRKPVAKQ